MLQKRWNKMQSRILAFLFLSQKKKLLTSLTYSVWMATENHGKCLTRKMGKVLIILLL